MNVQRPALRVALLALATVVLAFAVIATSLGWRAHTYINAHDRATAVVAGTVVEDGIGDLGDIRVRWMDHTGREHVQRFAIYNTDRYTKGRTFDVAYDPAAGEPRGFPADPDETSAEDDLVVPIELAGLVIVLIALGWALRGLWFRRAAKRPGHPMVASIFSGERVDGGSTWIGNSTWIALSASEHGSPIRWQRVMWHPVVDSRRSPVPVMVHGDLSSKRRVAVEMPGQILLVPIGRLRHRPPRRVVLEERSDVRAGLDDFLILPAGTPLPLGHRWWRRPATFALVGTALGVLLGLLFADGLAALPAGSAGCALLVNVWAMTGAEP